MLRGEDREMEIYFIAEGTGLYIFFQFGKVGLWDWGQVAKG